MVISLRSCRLIQLAKASSRELRTPSVSRTPASLACSMRSTMVAYCTVQNTSFLKGRCRAPAPYRHRSCWEDGRDTTVSSHNREGVLSARACFHQGGAASAHLPPAGVEAMHGVWRPLPQLLRPISWSLGGSSAL